MREIPLTRGKIALVDNDDFEKVNQYKWCAVKHKNTFYAVRAETLRSRQETRETGLPRQKMVYMHRFIMNTPEGVETDHINHNGLDNQKGNLRLCTTTQNLQNKVPCVGTSEYKGVYWAKWAKKWMTRIQYEGKQVYLGYFDVEIDAAKAYDTKAKELFGPFAYPNFVENTTQ